MIKQNQENKAMSDKKTGEVVMSDNPIDVANKRLEEMKTMKQRFQTNGTKLGTVMANDMTKDIQQLEENIMEALLKQNN